MILSADDRRKTLLEENIFSHLTNSVLKLASGETAVIVSTSGNGKTTNAATLAATGIEQSQKVIYFNNEMLAEDIYFKIAAAYAGIEFHGVDRLSEDQSKLLFNIIEKELCHNIVVVDDSYNGFESGVTTTVEGMRWCLKHLTQSNEKFDFGIIDYYQQIDTILASPGAESWKAQELFISELSRFRTKSKMPLIIFAQVKNQDPNVSVKDRIEGRKSIINKADIILELYSDHKNGTASLVVEKCRSNGSLKGTSFPLTYKNGRFHPASKGGK
jgi:replicative DNA helicase